MNHVVFPAVVPQVLQGARLDESKWKMFLRFVIHANDLKTGPGVANRATTCTAKQVEQTRSLN